MLVPLFSKQTLYLVYTSNACFLHIFYNIPTDIFPCTDIYRLICSIKVGHGMLAWFLFLYHIKIWLERQNNEYMSVKKDLRDQAPSLSLSSKILETQALTQYFYLSMPLQRIYQTILVFVCNFTLYVCQSYNLRSLILCRCSENRRCTNLCKARYLEE